jgi:hypothetical protein
MIIIKLLGGIGNQMFEYAFGRSLSLKNKTVLKLDAGNLGQAGSGTIRQYDLAVFNIEAELATKAEARKIRKEPPGKWLKKIKRQLKIKGWLAKKNYLKEADYPIAELTALGDNVYLEGFFHSEKYFLAAADAVRKDFALKPELANFNPSLMEKIKNSNAVSVHIRRGDYASDPATQKMHGLQPLDYYRQALKKINQKITNPRFFVFSDDLDWCRTNLPMPEETVFVAGQKNYEDLTLMSKCKHNIIANSSFSWWGAWLNDNPDKIVIAPKQWFADEEKNNQAKDFVPEGWIRI